MPKIQFLYDPSPEVPSVGISTLLALCSVSWHHISFVFGNASTKLSFAYKRGIQCKCLTLQGRQWHFPVDELRRAVSKSVCFAGTFQKTIASGL